MARTADIVCTGQIESVILDAFLAAGATLVAKQPKHQAGGQLQSEKEEMSL